jgi:uncharacterized protein
MIDLRETGDGIIVPIRAHPKARRNGVTGVHAGRLKIAVTAPPERGKANDAIAALLADALRLRPAQIGLLSGATSSQKEFLVTGATLVFVRDALANIVRAGQSGGPC